MRKYYKILFDRINYHEINFHLEPLELNFVVARYILLVTVVLPYFSNLKASSLFNLLLNKMANLFHISKLLWKASSAMLKLMAKIAFWTLHVIVAREGYQELKDKTWICWNEWLCWHQFLPT